MSELTEKQCYAEAVKEISQLSQERDELRANVDAAHRELVSHREKAHGNYWAWDECEKENHLESLSFDCPVLIHGADLHAILKEHAALESTAKYWVEQHGIEATKRGESEHQLDLARGNLAETFEKLERENAALAAKVKVLRDLLAAILEVADLLDYDETKYWTNRITNTLAETGGEK